MITEHALITPEDCQQKVDRVLRMQGRVVLATELGVGFEKVSSLVWHQQIFDDIERSGDDRGMYFTATD